MQPVSAVGLVILLIFSHFYLKASARQVHRWWKPCFRLEASMETPVAWKE